MQEQRLKAGLTEPNRLHAVEAIRQAKARYFHGVDTDDGDLVRSILAEDCVLDYTDCFVDPMTGTDYFPQMNVVVRGRGEWPKQGLPAMGIVTVHQGHHSDIEITGEATASGIWAMTDHIFLPTGAPHRRITGHGYYHEIYQHSGGVWQIKTLRISRLWVEAQ